MPKKKAPKKDDGGMGMFQKLLGSGMAQSAAKKMKSRKSRMDAAIKKSGG
jgi:hypothetical protein